MQADREQRRAGVCVCACVCVCVCAHACEERKSDVADVFTQALWLSTQGMSPRKPFQKDKCRGPAVSLLNQTLEWHLAKCLSLFLLHRSQVWKPLNETRRACPE